MKRVVCVFIGIWFCLACAGAWAAESDCAVSYSQYEFQLTVSGDFQRPVNLMVFKDIPELPDGGMTALDALEAGYDPVFIRQFEQPGAQILAIPLPRELADGRIQVFVDGKYNSGYPYINAATVEGRGAVIPAVNSIDRTSAAAPELLRRLVEENKTLLDLDEEAFRFWDTGCAEIFMNYLPIAGESVSEQLIAFDRAFGTAVSLREINRAESEAQIIAVLRENAAELGFDEEAFDRLSAGEKSVYTAVLSKADFAQHKLADIFREAAVVARCANAEHSSNLRAAVEQDSGYIGIELDAYDKLDETFVNMMDGIAGVRSCRDIKALFASANAAAVAKNQGGGSSGGHRGGGGGGFGGADRTLEIREEEPASGNGPEADREPYSDISGVEWAREAILSLTEKGIINGVEPGRFDPDAPITRAEFAKLTACAGKLELYEKVFADVSRDDWFCKYVGACSESGIMLGMEDGTMAPDRYITRQDAAVMIKRLADRMHPLPEAAYSFADGARIAGYAAEAVGCLADTGIMKGYEDNTFRPEGSITRAESAVILYRLLEA